MTSALMEPVCDCSFLLCSNVWMDVAVLFFYIRLNELFIDLHMKMFSSGINNFLFESCLNMWG